MTTDLTAALRAAVERRITSGATEYRIAKDAAVSQIMVSRFRAGGEIKLGTAAKLAAALGLELRDELL